VADNPVQGQISKAPGFETAFGHAARPSSLQNARRAAQYPFPSEPHFRLWNACHRADTLPRLALSTFVMRSSSSEVFLAPLARPSGIAENSSQKWTQYSHSELHEKKSLDPKSEIVPDRAGDNPYGYWKQCHQPEVAENSNELFLWHNRQYTRRIISGA